MPDSPQAGHPPSVATVTEVNLFNHVNLGNPDADIGVPGNDNPNAGFINSTAYLGADPQRIVQLGARFAF